MRPAKNTTFHLTAAHCFQVEAGSATLVLDRYARFHREYCAFCDRRLLRAAFLLELADKQRHLLPVLALVLVVSIAAIAAGLYALIGTTVGLWLVTMFAILESFVIVFLATHLSFKKTAIRRVFNYLKEKDLDIQPSHMDVPRGPRRVQ